MNWASRQHTNIGTTYTPGIFVSNICPLHLKVIQEGHLIRCKHFTYPDILISDVYYSGRTNEAVALAKTLGHYWEKTVLDLNTFEIIRAM